MRIPWYDQDDRAGLRGYVQFNKYIHTHTHTHTQHTHTHTHNTHPHTLVTSIIDPPLGRINASGIE